MRRISLNACACALVSISLASCDSTEAPPRRLAYALEVADPSLKSKILARIEMLSPTEEFEIDPRADIASKARVVVDASQKGPETLKLTWAKVKGKPGDFAYWTMTPMQREESYEAEAKLAGPGGPGRYKLRWSGTYELRGPDGKVKDLEVDSNAVEFTVRK